MKKFLLCILCAAAILPCVTVRSHAAGYSDDAVYKTYAYNNRMEPVILPSAFSVERVLSGTDITGRGFSEPVDLFYDGQGRIYLCDTGNDRVVVMDTVFQPIAEIADFEWEGRQESLSGPQGSMRTEKRYIFRIPEITVSWPLTQPTVPSAENPAGPGYSPAGYGSGF